MDTSLSCKPSQLAVPITHPSRRLCPYLLSHPSDYAHDAKPSVFDEVLRPRHTSSRLHGDNNKKAIQVEIHVTLSPKQIKASILLNKLRLIGIFDLILELKRFVFDKLPEEDGMICNSFLLCIQPLLAFVV